MKKIPRYSLLLLLLAMPVLHAETPSAPVNEGVETSDAQTASLSQQTQGAINEHTREALVTLSMELLDTTYRYGGNSPLSGLDCSGLVRFVYEQAAGLNLPRSSREMAHTGERVDTKALLPGDLLFFARPRRPVSHVGIYIGDGMFIHAASKSKKVKISDLDQRYYLSRLVGARRYLPE